MVNHWIVANHFVSQKKGKVDMVDRVTENPVWEFDKAWHFKWIDQHICLIGDYSYDSFNQNRFTPVGNAE